MSRAWLLLLLLTGCATPNLDTEPRLILGTGDTAFAPLTDAVDELPLTSGVQGGQHVWGALRATGVDWTNLTVTWELLDAEGNRAADQTTIRQALNHCTRSDDACERGMGEIVAVTVIIDDLGVRGDELTMVVRAEDEQGRTAEAQSQISPVFLLE